MPSPAATNPIDWVDDEDHPVRVVPRGQALVEGANFRTAHVFVFSLDGELLLQRLAETRERHPGRWGSSVASYLHASETYDQAARRRLFEELGLDAPLTYVGKIRMQEDGDSLKFVALYRTTADHAEIYEPRQIAELRYWSGQEIVSALCDSPDEFTPTFQQLYERFESDM
jgi:isopentenyl-diphosphate Delta-isomerase